MKLKIGILGTRGIPNRYGGFEQFAGYLSQGLVAKGHEVSVYNSHNHPYREDNWHGVQIIHCYDLEHMAGTAGQFIYDLNCIRDARKRNFDILLFLGYTSSSVWGLLYPKKAIVITNMDGLEWKRSKYSSPVQRFLQFAEKLAIQFSHRHIADSIPIKEHLAEKYQVDADYISYGAALPEQVDETLLKNYGVSKRTYFLLIARMEPENNIETILDGLCVKNSGHKVLVIGNTGNAYGRKLIKKYKEQKHILFPGTVYDRLSLDTLRACCLLYFHGHSVGGTNPSLLEAMACGALICAHDNVFNRAVLQDDAFYFYSEEDITETVTGIRAGNTINEMIEHNFQKIRDNHNWAKIINAYEQVFIQSCQSIK